LRHRWHFFHQLEILDDAGHLSSPPAGAPRCLRIIKLIFSLRNNNKKTIYTVMQCAASRIWSRAFWPRAGPGAGPSRARRRTSKRRRRRSRKKACRSPRCRKSYQQINPQCPNCGRRRSRGQHLLIRRGRAWERISKPPPRWQGRRCNRRRPKQARSQTELGKRCDRATGSLRLQRQHRIQRGNLDLVTPWFPTVSP
jgi:hypothetical protein